MGLFNNVYGRNGSYVTAGQQDYAERMNQIQTQKEAYYETSAKLLVYKFAYIIIFSYLYSMKQQLSSLSFADLLT